MTAGVEVATQTWIRAVEEFGWSPESVDMFAMHQVSQVHTQKMADTVGFGLDTQTKIWPIEAVNDDVPPSSEELCRNVSSGGYVGSRGEGSQCRVRKPIV